MTQRVSINLGEMGPAFAKRYPGSIRVQHQPAGIDFYSIDWERPRGVVIIDHGKNSFEIEDALSVLTSQSLSEFKEEGLSEFSVSRGMSVPDPGLIAHDEARLKTYAILRRILDAGWKTTIPRSRPRLKGQARLEYCLNVSDSIGLDPAHQPTFEEWMRISSHTSWSFYADGAFLSVEFTRERTLTDPNKPGSYLLTFKIQSAIEYFRGYAGPDNRLRWKELLPAELAKVAKLRAEKEAELKAKGVLIDDSYQDPPPPAL
jgi:hypothetical protein